MQADLLLDDAVTPVLVVGLGVDLRLELVDGVEHAPERAGRPRGLFGEGG